MFQVGGYKPGTVIDFEIPKKYGPAPDHRRHAGHRRHHARPAHHPGACWTCARDMEELCPDVTFLQYVNPMAMNCWAINRASKIKTVGLCHSVQGTAEALAHDIGVPIERDQLHVRRHQPHGVLPQLRARRRRLCIR